MISLNRNYCSQYIANPFVKTHKKTAYTPAIMIISVTQNMTCIFLYYAVCMSKKIDIFSPVYIKYIFLDKFISISAFISAFFFSERIPSPLFSIPYH